MCSKKESLRNYYKKARDAMPGQLAGSLSAKICDAILQWGCYQEAESIFFYYPLGKEASLLPVIENALSCGKHAAFPKVCGESMEFYEIGSLADLKEGCFHVMEPSTSRKAYGPSLCFVPGTAFDKSGGRFGYGKGYYDRYFAGRRGVVLAGCAYSFQIADSLPTSAWDVRMDYLASEQGIYPAR